MSDVTFTGKAKLNGLRISAEFIVNGAEFEKEAELDRLKVEGLADFRNAQFSNALEMNLGDIADFKSEHINFLICRKDKRPIGEHSVSISFEGTRFGLFDMERKHTLDPGSGNPPKPIIESKEELFSYLIGCMDNNHVQFNADLYTRIEECFQKRGQVEYATRTYIARREGERARMAAGFPWVVISLSYYFTDYGRGYKVLVASTLVLLFIAVAFFAVRNRLYAVMKPNEAAASPSTTSQQRPRRYPWFWYPVNAFFFPSLELHAAKEWSVRPKSEWDHHMHRFLVLGGWFLITVVGATLVSSLFFKQ